MIYCPECGTANRDGSNFCNNCGKRLSPGQMVRCPMCNASNPLDAETCRECGARLKPLRLESSDIAPPAREPEKMAPGEMPYSEQPSKAGESSEATFEELPEWLKRLRAAVLGEEARPVAKESPTVPLGEEEKKEPSSAPPDWLSEVSSEQAAGPAEEERMIPPAPEKLPPPEELPDWLREIISAEETAVSAEETPEAEAEIPSWLRDIVTEEQETAPSMPSEKPSTAEESIPDWLKEIEEAADSALGAEESQAELPDWSSTPRGDYGQEPPEPTAETPAAAKPAPEREGDSEVKDFILETAVPDWLREAMESPAATLEEPSEEEDQEIMEWLRDLGPVQESPLEKEGISSAKEEIPGVEAETTAEGEVLIPQEAPAKPEIPDWLQELAPPGFTKDTTSEELEGEGLAKAELPDWLEAMRPPEARQPAPEAELDKVIEGSGLLAGIKGVLPIEMVWALSRRARPAPIPPALPAEAGPAEVFADILAGRPEQRAAPAARRRVSIAGIGWRLIYLLVILAAVAPLFLDMGWLAKSVTVGQSTRDLFDIVDKMPAGSAVLLSFDYDPITSAEIDLQARALMRHLLERRSRIIAVSLVPQGPELAQMAWAKVSQNTEYQYGQDFLNLGYLAGQESGLRRLSAGFGNVFLQDFKNQKPLSSYALTQEVNDPRDLALTVVLTGDSTYVRYWLEQVQSQYPIRIAAGVAALAGPSVLPYYQSGQLSGLIVGASGAAEYEIATNRPSLAVSSLGAQSLVHFLFILIIVAGNLALLGQRAKRRK